MSLAPHSAISMFAPLAEVVVVGAGFAGLEVARALGKAGIATTIIDRRNHHLFQPLLYQVASAALSATDVAEPGRKILRRYTSVKVLFGEVDHIDTVARTLRLTSGQNLDFTHLVVASGAGHSYFGHDAWEKFAPGLKTIEDALHIRSQILLRFEQAERTLDPENRKRLLRFAIIGGGPTGVELAGAIAELSRHTLARDFRVVDPTTTRISLIEAGPCLLSAFDDDLSSYARRRLERLGVDVRTVRRSKTSDRRRSASTVAMNPWVLPCGRPVSPRRLWPANWERRTAQAASSWTLR